MYNLTAVLGYKINETSTLKLGYRYLAVDFEQDRFKFDVALSGLGVGIGIRF